MRVSSVPHAAHAMGSGTCCCEVQVQQARAAGGEAGVARRASLEVPQVGEHAGAAARAHQRDGGRGLEVGERRRFEGAVRGQRLHRARCRRGSGSRRSRPPRSRGRRRPIARSTPAVRRAARRAGCTSRNTRRPTSWAASADAARANPSTDRPLFSAASASGCAVSRPIATSSDATRSRKAPRPRADQRRVRLHDHAIEPREGARDCRRRPRAARRADRRSCRRCTA